MPSRVIPLPGLPLFFVMLKKILKALRKAKAAAYVSTLKKQLKRLEARHEKAKGTERLELQRRVNRKRIAIERLLALLLFVVPNGCAHIPLTDTVETAVIAAEGALELCKGKHKSDEWDGSQPARDAREACLKLEDVDRTRDATTALDDAVEAMAEWIRTGA